MINPEAQQYLYQIFEKAEGAIDLRANGPFGDLIRSLRDQVLDMQRATSSRFSDKAPKRAEDGHKNLKQQKVIGEIRKLLPEILRNCGIQLDDNEKFLTNIATHLSISLRESAKY